MTSHRHASTGFVMLEVLVTIVILVFAARASRASCALRSTTAVASDANVTLRFSEAMNGATITVNRVVQSDGEPFGPDQDARRVRDEVPVYELLRGQIAS
jgi:hypothetical protein